MSNLSFRIRITTGLVHFQLKKSPRLRHTTLRSLGLVTSICRMSIKTATTIGDTTLAKTTLLSTSARVEKEVSVS